MAMTTLPEHLYHGTRTSIVPTVLAHGLLPRSRSGSDNWSHTVSSHRDAVYLTSAYALHFALGCRLEGDPCILRIRTAALDSPKLVADEDSYSLLGASHPKLSRYADLHERVAFWRDRLAETDAALSLAKLGNCAYLDGIPAESIDSVLVLSREQAQHLVFAFADPVISPLNFRIFGPDYIGFTQWLFTRELQWTPRLGNPVESPGRLFLGELACAARYQARSCA